MIKCYKILFTNGTGDNVPSIPDELGIEKEMGWWGKYHFFVVIETSDIEKVINWYNNQYTHVSEGVYFWERLN